jgi:hypothetical protein
MRPCLLRLLLLLLPAVLLCPAARAWTLWESPYGDTEVLDQRQLTSDTGYSMAVTSGVGQTFVPRATPLARLDVLVKNRTDQRPGRLRLWKWEKTLAATMAQLPLFSDVVDLSGRDTYQQRAYFPNLPVEVGATYFVEFSAPGRDAYYLAGSPGTRDEYADGQLWVNGAPRAGKDLYFRTFTAPQGAPTPRVLQPSDPALPWTAPQPPGPPATRADYLGYVQQMADSLRTNAISGDGKYSYAYVVYEGFLYRVTHEESYAKNVALMLRNAAKWRAAHPTEEVGFPWMESPGMAYLCTRQSPSLTADDHAVIRALLLDSARKHWPLREHGAMNRSLGSAVTYLLASRLFPDAPEAGQWAQYADSVWNEFWAARDTDEDSGHYNYLAWRYILEYAMIAGKDDQVWADPAFTALVDRFAQHFSPLGVDAGYGDALGWAVEWPTAIWLFEKAAAKWHAPRYRWLAARIFDYHRTHLRNEKPWVAIYQDGIAFTFAYSDADDTLVAAPPPPRGEQTVLDQQQGETDWTMTGAPLGQTFVATATPLVRLALRIKHDGDPHPATLKLWKWVRDYATTVAAPPLYQDTLDLRDGTAYREHACFPFLDVEVGATYYVECERPDAGLTLAGTKTAHKDVGPVHRREAVKTGALWMTTATLPPTGSVITRRREAVLLPPEQRAAIGNWYRFTETMVPEKLILRSGYEMDDLFAQFDLLNAYGHGHVEIGALSMLTDHGAVLLHENDYRDGAQDQDENMPVLTRYAGGELGVPGTTCAIDHFRDYRRVTVAGVSWVDPHGWQVRQQRRVFFVKNRFLLVRDGATFPSAMTAGIGPVWHAADVHPARATNWFDLYYREPRGLAWTYANPERYALLYLLPRAGYTVQAWKEAAYAPKFTSPPYVLTQYWVGNAAAGKTLWFDSLLLPHGKELAPADAADQVSVLYDDGVGIAVQVRCGEETWTVVDNPAGTPITGQGIDTDARYLVARTQPNTASYLLASQATRVTLGTLKQCWPAAVMVEEGGN